MEDLHAELRAYNDALVAGMTLDEQAAAARQQRTTAAELGLLPVDGLDETASLPHRIAFLNDLYEEVRGCGGPEGRRWMGAREWQQVDPGPLRRIRALQRFWPVP